MISLSFIYSYTFTYFLFKTSTFTLSECLDQWERLIIADALEPENFQDGEVVVQQVCLFCGLLLFLASQDALEVMPVTYLLTHG